MHPPGQPLWAAVWFEDFCNWARVVPTDNNSRGAGGGEASRSPACPVMNELRISVLEGRRGVCLPGEQVVEVALNLRQGQGEAAKRNLCFNIKAPGTFRNQGEQSLSTSKHFLKSADPYT